VGDRAADGEDDQGGDGSGGDEGPSGGFVTSTGPDEAADDGVDDNTASAEATDVDTSASDTSTSDSSPFIPETDLDTSCGQPCDIWAPMDCPEGQKCTMVGCEVGTSVWDSNVCRDIQGDAQVGDECMYTDGSALSGNDNCYLGSVCWDADPDTGIGYCVSFCSGSPDAPICPEGSKCTLTSSGVINLCLPTCEPLAQDCGQNNICIPVNDSYECVLDASGGQAPYGTPCNYINSCNAGLICVDASLVPAPQCTQSSGCCSPMCSISAGAPCPGAGQSCEPVFNPQPPGYEDVGVCVTTGP
jgi:hypothetical protein